ncbi:EcoAI/FtnUII family type I restriction enzme subunit R [Larkinella punicea]|uniref:Restriction endonuclease subunit R n=1 Tax=Larkinella punicea TaxID=2315727 RepID=A0A368JN77_9BACT|nr:type I restriction endonuclease subunit R [Larkinella punicea]RCR68486.1 restriction endonuclease subunit R [Larkinella punicea]
MNEAETRAELIDPKLTASGWGVVANSKVLREYHITAGRIQTGGVRGKKLTADYVLVYKGIKLAVIEAKSNELPVGEGVAQAKNYADLLGLDTTYAANGHEIYRIDMKTGQEGTVAVFPTPDQLWNKTFDTPNHWRDQFSDVPFESVGGSKDARYYQERAVNNVMAAIADSKPRILLTLATGTGKTFISFQIAWKLFKTRWNLRRDGLRQPRILFLADRNILADQAFNAFSAFPDDALVRISPHEIRKRGSVPTNGSIFFTIFQTFMSGRDADGNPAPYFGAYPADYFDFIIIDECHRGGANDESTWRDILEYFSPAVQLGLTATPKRDVNADTYRYFGDPVYVYSLKEGINDGFLTPFKVKRIQTTLDNYLYSPDDVVVEGEVETGREYTETDFNRIIEIKEREAKRVEIYLKEADQREKAIVFCASQDHALAIRDLINQQKTSRNPNYCVRVTANDGALGEQYLREFQDNEKTIPTILTTSQKLSTGVDARNIRNIVLLRPVNSMVEFKQIIGRGTRLFEGKDFFTIYDYVGAYKKFIDPEWDGPPEEPEATAEPRPYKPLPKPSGVEEPEQEGVGRPRLKIKLRDGKDREIQHMMATSFWSADGQLISAEEFLNALFGTLPDFFKNEDELRAIWSNPMTRKTLLANLADAGYGKDELRVLQRLIQAENSDLFDVLEYISFARKPISRADRVAEAESHIFALLDPQQKEFLEFVLDKYIESGVEELDREKLPGLLMLKYHSIPDAVAKLGGTAAIQSTFIDFQKYLYQQKAA